MNIPYPTLYDFCTTYNATLKAYEVAAVPLPFPIFEKERNANGFHDVWRMAPHVPRILTETATAVRAEQHPNGIGDMGFKARTFWKTPEAAWKAAVKANPGRKLLTLAETAEAVKARKVKAKKERLAELRKEAAKLEKELA